MKISRLPILLLALLTFGQTTWAQNLIINSVDDWNTFAQSVTNGTTYSGQTVQLNADIAVNVMAGRDNKCFAGTFDGQGHTITLNMTANRQFTALFSYADGATFQNLKVDGTINTAVHKFCAGIVGAIVYHGCTFTNCVSDVTINSSINGDGTHGGLVAYIREDNSTFEGCAFTGKLLGANTSYVGGLVGFTDSRNYATVSFTNCVFHPQQVTMSGNGSQTFARWFADSSGSVIIGDNCYYSQTLGAAQGKQMRSITGGNYVTVAFSGEATTYERSGISAYSVGIVYDSTLYAGSGDTVSLNLSCTPPTGYFCNGYTTNNGTLTGSANPYTLTMPNEAVTIQAVLEQPPVAYIDENGVEQYCTSYTVVTSRLNFSDLPAGWYVVNENITLIHRNVHFSSDAHLILCDGATMSISNDGEVLYANGSLTLYGQSERTGSLTATSNNGIGIYASSLTINGSTVTAIGSGNGIETMYLIINSGTVNASGNSAGISVSYVSGGYVTINGGKVTTNSIYSPTITLGWSDIDDSITVGNFAYSSTPTVSVKSGQALCYEEDEDNTGQVIISGTLNSGQISAIGGKTLRPYLGPCASPSNLEVTDIETTTATLHWNGWTEEYEVMYEAVGAKATREVSTSYNHSAVITDLTPNTTYQWKVRGVDCDGNGTSTDWSEWSTFTTPEVCATPKDFTASNITSVSADLSWTGSADVESYTVRYRSAAYYKNDDDAGEWMTKSTPETEAQLNDLSGGTEYEAQVRSDCNPDGWCNMITFTTLDENTKVFVNDGDWDDDDNWIPAEVPTIDNDVILRAEATIPSDCVAEANAITIDSTATLTIEDGGQLKTNANIKATIKKDIDGYGTNNAQTNNGYYLIASPATDSIAAANAGLITAQSDYDLYSWNRTATDEEWHNNHNGIYLQNGVGYLYANRNNKEMNITATLRNSSNPITLTAAYDEEHGGWNLYGNPFPCEVYLSTDAEGLTFYHLVGNEFVPVTDAIAPMEGFFVVATAANQTFTISREGPEQPVHP